MPEEFKAKITEEKVVSQEVATPAPQPTAQEELARLKTEFTTAQGEVKKWQEEAKTHQSNFTRTQQRLKEAEQLRDKVDGLADDIKILADFIAKKGDGLGEPAPAQTLSLEAERSKRSQQKIAEMARQADVMATQVGLNMEDSPELQKALNLFLRGRAEAGLAEVERVVSEKKQVAPVSAQATAEKPKQMTPEEEEEIARRVMERKGQLKSDTGSPSAAGRDWKVVRKSFAEGEISVGEYEAEARKRGIQL